MPRGRALSEDLRLVIVHMATTVQLDVDTVTHLTKVPRRTIERIISRYQANMQVMPQRQEHRGRRRILTYDDLAVYVLSIPSNVNSCAIFTVHSRHTPTPKWLIFVWIEGETWGSMRGGRQRDNNLECPPSLRLSNETSESTVALHFRNEQHLYR